jgi:hypothetical protein
LYPSLRFPHQNPVSIYSFSDTCCMCSASGISI